MKAPGGIITEGKIWSHTLTISGLILPSEVSGGVCLSLGRGGLHSLLAAIVI